MKNYHYNFNTHENYLHGKISLKRLDTFFNINFAKYFIETGTYKGDGVVWSTQRPNFSKSLSTELHSGLYNSSKQLFAENKSVEIFNKDTIDFLNYIFPIIKHPALIYLDAHISGSDSTYNPNYPVPLLQETNCILEKFYDLNEVIVVIDDERCWEKDLINKLIETYKNKDMLSAYLDDSIVFCRKKWLK